jgi:hypothetical protein
MPILTSQLASTAHTVMPTSTSQLVSTALSVPCARYFSFEANIYVRGFLDMRVLPFSYPHPFLPPSLPWVALLNSRPLLCRISSEKLPWKFCLVFLPNSVSKSGGVPCHCGPPTWRPRGTISLSLLVFFFCWGLYPFGTWTPRRILLGGFSVFVSPWQLKGITFLCITLYDFVLSCVLLNHSFHCTLLYLFFFC